MLSKALEDANEKSKLRIKEQQSFKTAGEYSVEIKLGGIRQFVPLDAVQVNGKALAEYLVDVTQSKAKVAELEKTVEVLTQSSSAQANSLRAVIATLKGEKL